MTLCAKGVPINVTFAKFCMTKGGDRRVQQKVTNDDKTLERGRGVIKTEY